MKKSTTPWRSAENAYPAGMAWNRARKTTGLSAIARGLLAAIALAGSNLALANSTAQIIELVPPAGNTFVLPLKLSANGQVVAGGISNGSQTHAFLWTKDIGTFDLQATAGPLEASSFVYATSFDGSVLAGTFLTLAAGPQAFRWTPSSFDLDDSPTRHGRSAAAALSADGKTLIGTSPFDDTPSSGQQILLWSQSHGLRYLGDASIEGHQASYVPYDVSWDGDVIVGDVAITDIGHIPFRWSLQEGELARLDTHRSDCPENAGWPVSQIEAEHVSGNGQVVSGYIVYQAGGVASSVPYRWTQTGGLQPYCQTSDTTDAHVGAISGLSYDGSIMAGTGIRNGIPTALRWTSAGTIETASDWFARLGGTLPAVTFSRALGMSGDGQTLLVEGVDPTQIKHYYLLSTSDAP